MKLSVAWDEFARDLPMLLIVATLFLTILTWDMTMLILFVLLVVNVGVASVLKNAIQQRRPKGALLASCSHVGIGIRARSSKSIDWGMPSGHTQLTMSFFAYVIFLLVWSVIPRAKAGKKALLTWITIPVFVVAPFLVAYQRLHSKCHSLPQVAVAGIVGILLAGIAAYLTVRLKARPRIDYGVKA
jgi:membrane-associated phospholipid phosphatase